MSELSDDHIYRQAAISLSDLRWTPQDHPFYGARLVAAFAWVNSAQERLAAAQKPVIRSVVNREAMSDVLERAKAALELQDCADCGSPECGWKSYDMGVRAMAVVPELVAEVERLRALSVSQYAKYQERLREAVVGGDPK